MDWGGPHTQDWDQRPNARALDEKARLPDRAKAIRSKSSFIREAVERNAEMAIQNLWKLHRAMRMLAKQDKAKQ